MMGKGASIMMGKAIMMGKGGSIMMGNAKEPHHAYLLKSHQPFGIIHVLFPKVYIMQTLPNTDVSYTF